MVMQKTLNKTSKETSMKSNPPCYAKPLFQVDQFKAMQKRLQGEPGLPNENAYYEEEMP